MDRTSFSPLASQFAARHLRVEAIDALRVRFAADRRRLVVIQDVLIPEVAGRLSTFLATEGRFAPEHGLYSVEDAVDRKTWTSAAEEDRFFRYGRLVGIPDEHRLSDNVLEYLAFRQTFQQPLCRRFFEALTGMALADSDDFGAHRMEAGDFLFPHDDDNRNRSLALVLYLSPSWLPEWGGQLQVIDHENVITVVPSYNSMVVFDVGTGAKHEVLPVARSAPPRLSIGGWYHRPT